MSKKRQPTAEEQRLDEDRHKVQHWRRWGPYLSERQWGTVREDYSANGDAWSHFNFDQARYRAYRWGEDGIAGISDNHQRLCFAPAFWNGKDKLLKERLFGLAGNEGTHGEDVKEVYFQLENTPSHAYMRYLYCYPTSEFPYEALRHNNPYGRRDLPDYEIGDTKVFDQGYFEISVEYAKHDADTMLIRIAVKNVSEKPETFWLLPTLWFRNTWSWSPESVRPKVSADGTTAIRADESGLGTYWLFSPHPAQQLFTENETNFCTLYNRCTDHKPAKDGFHSYVIAGDTSAVNSDLIGTKAAFCLSQEILANESVEFQFILSPQKSAPALFGKLFEATFVQRQKECADFYHALGAREAGDELQQIQRLAFSGLLWNKQYYHYVVDTWLKGDELGPPPPPERKSGRNCRWDHLYNDDILSMPDKWEYPWFAAWDLAFHVIPLAIIDPDFAKRQLLLLTREWYMHPNGQIPAYEWSFDDVNPPVHAWAAWRVYKIEKKTYGHGDKRFLESVFQKLLLNFTWWVNRKDPDGKNVFEGGFLGLDNIGVFDRSSTLPTGGVMEQSDSTSWMAMYALNMLTIALELAKDNPCYEDIASKFYEHFLYIAHAMNSMGDEHQGLWDEKDGFYYDVLHLPDGSHHPLRVRSMVGLIPLFAVFALEEDFFGHLPGFRRRMEWFIQNRPDLSADVASMDAPGVGERRLLSLVDPEKLRRILSRMLDENEFLSPFGIRSLSKYHEDHPYVFECGEAKYSVNYEPGESSSGLFGGNSNWRGPVWLPVNYLLIESLQRFHYYLGDEYLVECPTGSGKFMTLWDVAMDLSQRLIRLFETQADGKLPACFPPNFPNAVLASVRNPKLFYEYFNGDSGAGLGASHQAGWTALIAKLIQQVALHRRH